MAYLQEVNGKTASKTLLIGDGVDKTRSPLQVAPYMATDMLNLTSELDPALSIRNGRTLLFDQTRLSYLSTERFIAINLPFMDSVGNIHYIYLNYVADRSGVNLGGCNILWYIKKPTDNVPVLKSIRTFGFDTIPSPLDRESYATGNFCEYNKIVYWCYIHGGSGSHYNYILYYDIDAQTNGAHADGGMTGASSRITPTAIYLDKFFIGVDEQLIYSATGTPLDFTTAANSGTITLSQGGMITSITPMRDRLLISTKKALFLLMGSSFSTFAIVMLADNIGIKNPKCVTSRNGVVYFSANDGDIYEYNGNGLLVNITREPIDTGSKSGVRGGSPPNEIVINSLAIENNYLYCVDDRASYKDLYMFDLVKRRWYIHDYPYSNTTLDNFYNAVFEGDNDIYSIVTKVSTVGGMEQQVNAVYLLDNDTATDISTSINVAGTKQKETNTVIGTIGTSGNLKVTITNHPYYVAPDVSYIAVLLNDTAAQVAAKIKAAFDDSALFLSFNDFFTLTVNSATLTFERKQAVANVTGLNININNDTCTGLTETNSANTTAGVANTYTTSTIPCVAPFFWQSPAYQLTPQGKQALNGIHLTYYSPVGTTIGVYISNSVDGDDFIKVVTLPNSRLEQNSKTLIPIRMGNMNSWIRVKFQGTGSGVVIYNMTLEWRVLERLR